MSNQFLGRADTAVKLETARTIFSQSFDGSANVEGQAQVYGTGIDASRYIGGGLVVRESALVGAAQSDDRYAPRIGFRWMDRNGGNLIMRSNGNFAFTDSNSDTIYRNVQASTFIGALQGNATAATTATNATQLGGVAAANYLTTSDTLILAGTI